MSDHFLDFFDSLSKRNSMTSLRESILRSYFMFMRRSYTSLVSPTCGYFFLLCSPIIGGIGVLNKRIVSRLSKLSITIYLGGLSCL